jgi:hypothetical protein
MTQNFFALKIETRAVFFLLKILIFVMVEDKEEAQPLVQSDLASDIVGEGHGHVHRWENMGSRQVGAQLHGRSTLYVCRVCKWVFTHEYNRISDIFRAMKHAGVPQKCIALGG